MTSYERIYSVFLLKIEDYDFAELSDRDANEMLLGYLIASISKFSKCTSDLSKRDDIEGVFEDDLSDIEIEILALSMVEEWIRPQVNSTLLTKQIFGGAEEKFYAQSNQLDKVMALRDQIRVEKQKAYRDYQTEKFRQNNS